MHVVEFFIVFLGLGDLIAHDSGHCSLSLACRFGAFEVLRLAVNSDWVLTAWGREQLNGKPIFQMSGQLVN